MQSFRGYKENGGGGALGMAELKRKVGVECSYINGVIWIY